MSSLPSTNCPRQNVLGYPVDLVDAPKALDIMESAWHRGIGIHVVTLNSEMVINAQKDKELDHIIRQAELVIPDGSGVVWALRINGHKVDKLAGIDLAQKALNHAQTSKLAVALIGSKPEILAGALVMLAATYPGIKIVASHHGYFNNQEEESIVSKIAKTQPDLLLVALGVPRQEYFIDRWRNAFPKAVIIGVGGSFDIWSGTSTRAPLIMQRLHLEWLFRLMAEPWRASRMARALPIFFWQVIKETLTKKQDSTHEHKD